MPPRCAVPSPTAALRPVPSSQDGIWITDAMLARAIERYQRVSTTSCRHLSSLPGPLESRRRLGKRHMTALMPGSQASPAPWAIEVPWQLGEWKWEAPTASEDRNRKTKKPSTPRILDRLIGWLEDYEEDTTLASSPRATESASTTRLHETVVTIRQQIQEMESIEKTKPVIDLCHELERDLEAVIRLQMATSEDLLLAFNLFDADLKTRLHNEAYWDRVTASIGKTIIKTIASNRFTPRHDAYGARFWFTFIDKICTLTPQRETFNLFAMCMDSLPKAHFDLFNHEDFLSMTGSFITHQANKSKVKPATILEFSRALKRITPEHTLSLMRNLLAFTQELSERKSESQFYVAALMAFNTHVSSGEFLRMLNEIRGDGFWSQEEMFTFMQGRLWALKCVDPKQVSSFLRQSADSRGWVGLVMHASQASEQVKQRALKELCTLSSQLGCFETLAQALVSEIPHRSSVFQALAMASDDHRLALKLWEVLHGGKSVVQKPESWDWIAWGSYFERIIKDPSLDESIIWKIMSLDHASRNSGRLGMVDAGVKSKTQLLEMMTGWYLEATHLSDRQALRRIQNCISHYGRISPTISKVAISNLVQVILRDLEKGQFGRTTRLDYMVALIHKHLGKDEAEAVLAQIRGWRWSIHHHHEATLESRVRRDRLQTSTRRDAKKSPESKVNFEIEDSTANSRGINMAWTKQQKSTTAGQASLDKEQQRQHATEDDIFTRMRNLRRETA